VRRRTASLKSCWQRLNVSFANWAPGVEYGTIRRGLMHDRRIAVRTMLGQLPVGSKMGMKVRHR